MLTFNYKFIPTSTGRIFINKMNSPKRRSGHYRNKNNLKFNRNQNEALFYIFQDLQNDPLSLLIIIIISIRLSSSFSSWTSRFRQRPLLPPPLVSFSSFSFLIFLRLPPSPSWPELRLPLLPPV